MPGQYYDICILASYLCLETMLVTLFGTTSDHFFMRIPVGVSRPICLEKTFIKNTNIYTYCRSCLFLKKYLAFLRSFKVVFSGLDVEGTIFSLAAETLRFASVK